MKGYIVCGGSAGRAVVFGYSEVEPEPGKPIKLTRARMVLYWAADCGGLFGLAANGPKGETRIAAAVPTVWDSQVHQAIECTDTASAAIDAWKAA